KKQYDFIRLQFQIRTGFFALLRIETKLFQGNSIADDVDSVCRIGVKIDNFVFDHLRIHNHTLSSALSKERFFELQDVAMLAIQALDKAFQWHLESPTARQPRAMNAVAGAINIA